jgi:hypothetical protein
MPSLEVVRPGDGLSTVPSATPYDETAGGNGDGGIQLRPDSGDVLSSAGERLAAAMAGRRRLLTAMGLKFMQL